MVNRQAQPLWRDGGPPQQPSISKGNHMKHLLILIIPSILLLTSPLFGQETGVLYQYRTSTGLQWKTFGDGKVQPKYEGEIIYGEPNGQGIYTNPDGRKYVGKFKDGEYHGHGTFISLMETSM